ncbi:MAG: class I SAM-dependent methyltransferase [Ktedonobacteraceae bacterium]
MPADQPSVPRNKNTYIMDAQSAEEMARLLLQDRLISEAMGGLFPAQLDLARLHDVFDIACGPGGWILDVAREHPEMECTGIDIDRMLVDYGRAQAAAFGFDNAHFRVMDATKPLKFLDVSFDFVNARLLFGFMLPQKWPKLVEECFRILRPGGIIRLTECEAALTNSSGFEHLAGHLGRALKLAGQSFSSDGRTIGVTPMLRRFLRDVGCQYLQHTAYAVDWSHGADAYEATVQNFFTGFELVQPFLVKMKVASEDELEELYEQALVEMRSRDFCGVWYYLSVWGSKPASARP